jgi:radical SAM protein with 4Fe4S-binding SPASM domain
MISADFSVVLLPTLACNAACDYCFEQHRAGMLDHERLGLIVRQLLDVAQGHNLKRLNVFWQGGEVTLLSPEWFERAGEIFAKSLSPANVKVVHYLQTNLIGYDRSWNPLVHQMFGGSLGTSLDYPNLYRRPVAGQPEDFFPRWRQGYNDALQGDVHVGLIAVVNHATLATGAEAFYHFFVDELGISDFQVNTPFFARNQDASCKPLDPAALGQFLTDLADVWLAKGLDQGVKLGPFDELLNWFSGREGVLPCMWRPSCPHDLVSIDPDGNVAQCDCWVSSYPEHHYGNLFGDASLGELLTRSTAREAMLARPVQLVAAAPCQTCEYLAVCHGGCAIRALTASGQLASRDPYCESYLQLFAHMETITQQTRPGG